MSRNWRRAGAIHVAEEVRGPPALDIYSAAVCHGAEHVHANATDRAMMPDGRRCKKGWCVDQYHALMSFDIR